MCGRGISVMDTVERGGIQNENTGSSRNCGRSFSDWHGPGAVNSFRCRASAWLLGADNYPVAYADPAASGQIG